MCQIPDIIYVGLPEQDTGEVTVEVKKSSMGKLGNFDNIIDYSYKISE